MYKANDEDGISKVSFKRSRGWWKRLNRNEMHITSDALV